MLNLINLLIIGGWVPRVRLLAMAAIYVLAGIPELVELCLKLAGGSVDTHVLMTLAVFGTLAIGSALEA